MQFSVVLIFLWALKFASATREGLVRCAPFFGSQSSPVKSHDQGYVLRLHSDLPDSVKDLKFTVTIVNGDNFADYVTVEDLVTDKYVCDRSKWISGECKEEEAGQLVKRTFKNNEDVVRDILDARDPSHEVKYLGVPRTSVQCVVVHGTLEGIRVKEDWIDLESTFRQHYWFGYLGKLDGYMQNSCVTLIIGNIVSAILLFIFLTQWNPSITEFKMDNLTKMMTLYYGTAHCALPIAKWINLVFINYDWSFFASITQFVETIFILACVAGNTLFLTLLAKGYTLLTGDEYPLHYKSEYYRVCFVLSGLCTLTSLSISLQSLGSLILIVTYVYAVISYFRTKKLLDSLSLTSNTRRLITLKLLLFWLPLIYFGLLVVFAVLISTSPDAPRLVSFLIVPFTWKPKSDLIQKICATLADPIIQFIVLYFQWTPSKIYNDSLDVDDINSI